MSILALLLLSGCASTAVLPEKLRQMEELRSAIAEKEASLEAAHLNARSLLEQMEALVCDKQDCLAQVSDLSQDALRLESEVRRLERERGKFLRSLDSSETHYERLREDYERLRDLNEAYKEELDSLEKDYVALSERARKDAASRTFLGFLGVDDEGPPPSETDGSPPRLGPEARARLERLYRLRNRILKEASNPGLRRFSPSKELAAGDSGDDEFLLYKDDPDGLWQELRGLVSERFASLFHGGARWDSLDVTLFAGAAAAFGLFLWSLGAPLRWLARWRLKQEVSLLRRRVREYESRSTAGPDVAPQRVRFVGCWGPGEDPAPPEPWRELPALEAAGGVEGMDDACELAADREPEGGDVRYEAAGPPSGRADADPEGEDLSGSDSGAGGAKAAAALKESEDPRSDGSRETGEPTRSSDTLARSGSPVLELSKLLDRLLPDVPEGSRETAASAFDRGSVKAHEEAVEASVPVQKVEAEDVDTDVVPTLVAGSPTGREEEASPSSHIETLARQEPEDRREAVADGGAPPAPSASGPGSGLAESSVETSSSGGEMKVHRRGTPATEVTRAVPGERPEPVSRKAEGSGSPSSREEVGEAELSATELVRGIVSGDSSVLSGGEDEDETGMSATEVMKPPLLDDFEKLPGRRKPRAAGAPEEELEGKGRRPDDSRSRPAETGTQLIPEPTGPGGELTGQHGPPTKGADQIFTRKDSGEGEAAGAAPGDGRTAPAEPETRVDDKPPLRKKKARSGNTELLGELKDLVGAAFEPE